MYANEQKNMQVVGWEGKLVDVRTSKTLEG